MIEVLAVIAVIAIIAGITLVTMGNFREGVKEQKLRKDVSALNSAVKVYLANGGSLQGTSSAKDVVAKLKTKVVGDAARQLVGLKGSAFDQRVVPSEEPPKDGELRAVWSAAKQRFELKRSGAGIAAFILDESKATSSSTEQRATNVKYAKNGKWVWDYNDYGDGASNPPSNLPPGGTDVLLPPAPTPPSPNPLGTPIIAEPGGERPLAEYPISVAISNPNPAGVSEVMVSTTAGVWSKYNGPVEVRPGETLRAQAVSIDPDHWADSGIDEESYEAGAIAPELAVVMPSAVTYMELGGPLMPGNYPPPGLADPGSVSLLNGDAIPDEFESSSYFQVYWTYDGSDPASSSSREQGDVFSGGFTGQDIPLSMEDWGSGDTLTVRVLAASENPDVFDDGVIVEESVSITTVPLRDPVITVTSGVIEFDLEADFGDMPVGARVYYTTDGSDPGLGADNGPAAGTLYTGPFELEDDAMITARVYPPEDYHRWFTPSGSSSESYIPQYRREVYIGGRFALPDGTYRNIAKLGETGTIDPGFNTGLGASYGSTVGAVVPAAGGRVLVGGDFDTMGGTRRDALARLLPDGSLDPSFDAGIE